MCVDRPIVLFLENTSRTSQLSREERGQNLQFRNVNMQKYEHMIDSAKVVPSYSNCLDRSF